MIGDQGYREGDRIDFAASARYVVCCVVSRSELNAARVVIQSDQLVK